MEVQAMIMESIINWFLLARCQQKHYEQGYDIIKELLSKLAFFYGTAGCPKLAYFSLMKYFGFMLLTWSVFVIFYQKVMATSAILWFLNKRKVHY